MKYVTLSVCLLLVACSEQTQEKRTYSGYIEGEYSYAITPQDGFIEELLVDEGDKLLASQPIAQLDQSLQALQIKQLSNELKSQSYLVDDMKHGARAEEIAVVNSQMLALQEELKLVEKNITRTKELITKALSSQNELDLLLTKKDVLKRQIQSYHSQIAALKLPARELATLAQSELYLAKQAKLNQQQWLNDQRNIVSPSAGSVSQVFYRQREFVKAGTPILSILLDGIKKVRFTVPQSDLASFQLGETVWVNQDKTENPIKAKISFIAKKAEFTPPVLYGPRVRDKLVFTVEAEMENNLLNIGQPVDVYVE